jgi:hypothetical protein
VSREDDENPDGEREAGRTPAPVEGSRPRVRMAASIDSARAGEIVPVDQAWR